jgi:mannitol-specific phosphotransferase system IIBC component
MPQSEHKIGDISNSTVVGANVSGHGVSIHHNTLPEAIIEMLENQNESIKKLQQQMEHLIEVVNKLNDKVT